MVELHSWQLEPKQAIQVQHSVRERLVLAWDGREVRTVGGVDVSIKQGLARAAIAVLRFPELALLEAATAEAPVSFPYIPGLLSFREGPVVLAAWERLQAKPDLLLFDGQGIAHPRGIGLAAHMGLWLGCPSIGVAKTWLYGEHDEPGPLRGEIAELRAPERGQPGQEPHAVRAAQHLLSAQPVIGAVVRTRTGVKPLYVSPGHLIDVPHAVRYTLDCCTRYRLPETTRVAHRLCAQAPRVAGGGRLPERYGSK
jgi:deoxyribonuclease V